MLGSQRRKGSALVIAVILIAAGALFLFGLWAPAPSSVVQANPSSPVSVLADGEQFKTLRVYGRNNETAGADRNLATDLGTGAPPEDPPYTNPSGPFLPQLNEAPRKDSVTWNPAWMDEFEPQSDELWAAGLYEQIGFGAIKNLQEKVWFRMWYEPEHLDKDLDTDGQVITDTDEWYPAIMQEFTYLLVDPVTDQPTSGPVGGDQAPVQFVFPVGVRQEDLDKDQGFGLTSLDADFDGTPDIVRVYSELSLFKGQVLGSNGLDFNADGELDPLDPDGLPLTGDEVAVLSPQLPPGVLGVDDKVQFLEHIVEVRGVSANSAQLKITYNGSKTPHVLASSISVPKGQVLVAGRKSVQPLSSGCSIAGNPFFVYLAGTSLEDETVTLVIGRAVGGAYGAMDILNTGGEDDLPPDPWYLKRFYVDGHEYNVVAIMTQNTETPPAAVPVGSCDQQAAPIDTAEFQYITIRTSVPKVPVFINQHSVDLQAYQPVTGTDTSLLNYLSVLPPFNHEHTIRLDVNGGGGVETQVPPILQRPDERLPYQGLAEHSDPREVSFFYVAEESNEQFLGQLKEKYGEIRQEDIEGTVEEEFWYVEQFHTLPWEYTEFVFPDMDGISDTDLYLLTSAFTAPQGEYGFPDVGQIVASDIFTWTTANGQVQVDVNVFNNCAGDLSRYQWEYEVQNNTYNVSGGNGLSGFHVLFAPQTVGDVTDQSGPADWTENSHVTSPPNGVAWDIQDQPGIQPGESEPFSFCTLPRTPVQRSTAGQVHTWIGGTPTASSTSTLLVPSGTTDPELSPRVKFWFDSAKGAQDPDAVIKKYKDDRGLRLYGHDGWEASPGLGVTDPAATNTYPVEVKPYALDEPFDGLQPDPFGPMAPFNPQLPQAPVKDSLTFNPAYMMHGDVDISFDPLWEMYQDLTTDDFSDPGEKVFFRMWYEPQHWDGVRVGSVATEAAGVTIQASQSDTFPALMQEFTYMVLNPNNGRPTAGQPGDTKIAFPMATKPDDLPSPSPADPETLPSLTDQSRFGHGINSFDADFDLNTTGGDREIVTVHSEETLRDLVQQYGATTWVDFDGDSVVDSLDPDGQELSGDELAVLAIDEVTLEVGDSVQFLDNMVTLLSVSSEADEPAQFKFWYTGSGSDPLTFKPKWAPVDSADCCRVNDMVVIHRENAHWIDANSDNSGEVQGAWFMWLKDVDPNEREAFVMIGRAVGATHSAMYDGAGGADMQNGDPYYLKRFFVDGREYNVVAVKTVPSELGDDDPRDFKYITIRTPIPKQEFTNIVLSQALQDFAVGDVIPVMPPFNTKHTRKADITRLERPSVEAEDDPDVENFGETENEDCMGERENALPVEIQIVEETIEPQFSGSLDEIFVLSEEGEASFDTESFQTLPNEYTDLALSPADQLYLLTSSWRSDQSQLFFYACRDTIESAGWAGSPPEPPLPTPDPDSFLDQLIDAVVDPTLGARVKFWYDPNDEEDIYVNRFTLEVATPTPTVTLTPTDTPTNTPTSTVTLTPTATPTATPTSTPTATPTQQPGTCSITGEVFMQGRTDRAGASVEVAGTMTTTTTTVSDGLFTFLNLPVGNYRVTASHPGYLCSRVPEMVACIADTPVELERTWILGGDATHDPVPEGPFDPPQAVNLIDLVTVAAAFNTCSDDPLFNSQADINETGCVDLFDLVMVGVNYGMTGCTGWPTVDPPVSASVLSGSSKPAMRQPGASLYPEAERFDIRVEDVSGMYGIDVRLTFDAAEVRIVDADPERPGIQIEPGPLFAGSSYFPAKNRVQIDEKTGIGTVEFVAALLNPAEPIAGSGVAATILFEPVDASSTVASTALTIEDALLADPRGRVLPVVWEGGTIRQVKGHLIYLPIMAR